MRARTPGGASAVLRLQSDDVLARDEDDLEDLGLLPALAVLEPADPLAVNPEGGLVVGGVGDLGAGAVLDLDLPHEEDLLLLPLRPLRPDPEPVGAGGG